MIGIYINEAPPLVVDLRIEEVRDRINMQCPTRRVLKPSYLLSMGPSIFGNPVLGTP
jgi:hypothetical protein